VPLLGLTAVRLPIVGFSTLMFFLQLTPGARGGERKMARPNLPESTSQAWNWVVQFYKLAAQPPDEG